MLILDKEKSELLGLRQGKLEAPLTEHWRDKDLGKIVSLELADNGWRDGIELKYLPDSAENWEAIQKVQVRMNERAYNHVETRGEVGTRYGMEDKIEIFNGDLRFDF